MSGTVDRAVAGNGVALIVLAAGAGTRMKSSVPKPLHPVAGLPMLWHVLEAGESVNPTTKIVVLSPSIADDPAWIGTGFDVHIFGDGEYVTLGGVRVPHSRGVVAHSDGDVVIHALCDAIFGALAWGDIGTHFPPSDPQWRHADSRLFLRHATRLMAERASGRYR